jgi:hypothetical protein
VSLSDGGVTVGPFAASTSLVVPAATPATVVVPPVPPAPVVTSPPVTPPALAPAPAAAPAVAARAPAQPAAAVGLPGAGIAAPEALLHVGPVSLEVRRWSAVPVQLQGTSNHMELGGPVQVGLELASAQAELAFGPLTPPEWTAQFAFPDEGKPHGEQDQIQVLLEQIKLGGMALSVGVVWWASRVSGLLGSLLASAPAWRHIDPLPVVGRDEDEDKQWYEGDDLERDADELAVSLVLAGGRERAGAD